MKLCAHTLLRLVTLLLLLLPATADAQKKGAFREVYVTWEDFVDEYTVQAAEDGVSEDDVDNTLEELDVLRAAPINLNAARREELLRIPFLTEAQADSLIAYREAKTFFTTLGEMQFVSGLSSTERRWLSLFLYAGESKRSKGSKEATRRHARQWHHELVTSLAVPLYQREGNKAHDDDELSQYPNHQYLGNGLANTVRYRLNYATSVRAGVTLQKDAGEPFATYSNYPYDYVSAYAAYHSPRGAWDVLGGDYEVGSGQGLLLGAGLYQSKSQLLANANAGRFRIKPHTSCNEARFFRGVAVRRDFGKVETAAFLSYRKRDALLSGDTASTIYTDGMHRTMGEIDRRRTLGNVTAGARVGYTSPKLRAGLTGVFDYYDHVVWPTLRDYNRYYLRGKTAAGVSADYTYRGRTLSVTGEVAADDGLHIATSHTARVGLPCGIALNAQVRYFSPRFVSAGGRTRQEGSRVQNETGVLLGATWRMQNRLELQTYVDGFLFHRPTYRASAPRSKGFEWSVTGKYFATDAWTFRLRYRVKTKQQTITDYSGYLEYVATHRASLGATYSPSSSVSIGLSADGVVATSQTLGANGGWMLSSRSAWKPSKKLSLSAFAALFFTDGYTSRLYAYEPQMRYAASFPSFYNHGMRLVGLCTWRVHKALSLSARYSLLHYFNRDVIGSGTQAISSSSQNDLMFQASFKI